MNLIKQSDTSKVIVLFMADSATPTAGKTGLTVTCRLSKNGAAFAAAAGTVAELEGGFYALTPTSADTGTLGPLAVRATATGAVDFVAVRQVVAFDPYAASLGLSLAKTTNITGFNDIAATAVVSGGAITTASGKVSGVTLVDTVTTYTGNTPQTGDAYARLGANGAGLTAIPYTGPAALTDYQQRAVAVTLPTNPPTDWLNAASVKADAVTKIQSGLATPTNITAGTITTVSGNVNGSVALVLDKTGYSLVTAPPTLSAITAGVWDQATSGHTTTGTFGSAMNAAGSAGDPWSTSLPGAYGAGTAGNIVGANLNATVSSRATPTNITAGTITTVTNLTNAPTAGDLTAAMKASVTAAVPTALTDYQQRSVAVTLPANAPAAFLDAITVTEPVGPSSGWNFRQWLRWLVMASNNAARTPTTLTVKTAAGATSTTQSVSDDGSGNEATGAAS